MSPQGISLPSIANILHPHEYSPLPPPPAPLARAYHSPASLSSYSYSAKYPYQTPNYHYSPYHLPQQPLIHQSVIQQHIQPHIQQQPLISNVQHIPNTQQQPLINTQHISSARSSNTVPVLRALPPSPCSVGSTPRSAGSTPRQSDSASPPAPRDRSRDGSQSSSHSSSHDGSHSGSHAGSSCSSSASSPVVAPAHPDDTNPRFRHHNQRKTRNNLPKETSYILLKWLNQHLNHPYPNSFEKNQLMASTGLNQQQLSNWFINARRRKIKFLKQQRMSQ